MVAGTGSGVGKTSIAMGITRALTRRGFVVQPFKTGPDYLDPSYLSIAAGRPCFNLDVWMMGVDHVRRIFEEAISDADVAVVEGVMGLYDGASVESDWGSSAHLAHVLGIPTLLAIDAAGMARTIAPLVSGCLAFGDGLLCAGVVANRVGSTGHGKLLEKALTSQGLPPLLGAIQKNSLPTLPERHLGLVTAENTRDTESIIDQLADGCEQYMDLDQLLARSRVDIRTHKPAPATKPALPELRLAVAQDAAFHFTYPDNLRALEAAGTRLCRFSPLKDEQLPDEVDGIYLPGGYPELYARQLSQNQSMRAAIQSFSHTGGLVYAECGGLMYLGDGIMDGDGKTWPMVGIIPIVTAIRKRLKALGYNEVTFTHPCLWGAPGLTLRGHAFHYSEIVSEQLEAGGWKRAYRLSRPNRNTSTQEGLSKGNVLASYVHLHWAANPDAVSHFISNCRSKYEFLS